MMHKASCGSGEAPYCFSRSFVKCQGHTAKTNIDFDPKRAFPDGHYVEFIDGYKMMHKAWSSIQGVLIFFQVIHQILRSYWTKKSPSFTKTGRFRTVTPVWIHICLWNNSQNLQWHKRGALLFFKVIRQISRKKSQILIRTENLRTVTPVWIRRWLWNDAQSLMLYRTGASLFFNVICHICRSHGTKEIADFDPNWSFPECNSSLN